MSNSMKKKVKTLEGKVLRENRPPAVALRRPDGSYDYNGKVFEGQEEFQQEVERIFQHLPFDPRGGPQVIVINFHRPRSESGCNCKR